MRNDEIDRLCHILKHDPDGPEQIISYIKRHTSNKSLRTKQKEVLERELKYYERNKKRMRYQWYRAKGLPIGTGLVESTQKWLIQARMKRAGMHWSRTGARRILALQVHLANKTYETWFEREFQRIA